MTELVLYVDRWYMLSVFSILSYEHTVRSDNSINGKHHMFVVIGDYSVYGI
jgi:hypothetical protein